VEQPYRGELPVKVRICGREERGRVGEEETRVGRRGGWRERAL